MKRVVYYLFSLILVFVALLGCDPIDPPDLLVQPTSLNFGEIDSVKTIKIINEGDERLDWYIDTVSLGTSWLKISPMSGYNEATVTVKVLRGNLSHATYKSNIGIISNGGDANVEVVMIVF